MNKDLKRNDKIEDLSMKDTCNLEEYLDILNYENILGQHDNLIESIEFLLEKNESFKNIKIV